MFPGAIYSIHCCPSFPVFSTAVRVYILAVMTKRHVTTAAAATKGRKDAIVSRAPRINDIKGRKGYRVFAGR
eukprot:11190419-Lingulodinium_polyedra.AAC.1